MMPFLRRKFALCQHIDEISWRDENRGPVKVELADASVGPAFVPPLLLQVDSASEGLVRVGCLALDDENAHIRKVDTKPLAAF